MSHEMPVEQSRGGDGRDLASETTPLIEADESQQKLPLLYRIKKEAWNGLTGTLFCSNTNVLLICVPLGLMAGDWGWPKAAVFVLNFLAMLPLASILTFATEQLAAVVGSVAGGLINATFGNAVEMIVGISALREGEIAIVQSSMIGSILSSIMLVSFANSPNQPENTSMMMMLT